MYKHIREGTATDKGTRPFRRRSRLFLLGSLPFVHWLVPRSTAMDDISVGLFGPQEYPQRSILQRHSVGSVPPEHIFIRHHYVWDQLHNGHFSSLCLQNTWWFSSAWVMCRGKDTWSPLSRYSLCSWFLNQMDLEAGSADIGYRSASEGKVLRKAFPELYLERLVAGIWKKKKMFSG